MSRAKIITRTILLISLVSFFNDISSEMLYPVMPIYLRSIGFSVFLIGILEGIAELTAGLSKGYFGSLSDKKGIRLPFVQLGYLLNAISKPMMVLLTHPLWIFTARTSDRLGKGLRTGARDAMLSDETTPENKGKVFGFHRGLDTLGAAVGPFVALIYLYYYPQQYFWLFIIAFLPGVCSIIITFFIKEKKNEAVKATKKVRFFSYISYWKVSTHAYKVLIIGLLAYTFFNSSDAFLLLALKAKSMSDTQMIGFYIFYNLVFAVLSYPIGMIGDKIGLKRTLIIGLVLFAITYIAMGFAFELWHFAIIFFIYGIYAAATDGISKALITNISKRSDTATAIGFYTSFASVFAFLASSLGGLLFYFNPKIMFIFSGIGVLLVIIFFIFVKVKADE